MPQLTQETLKKRIPCPHCSQTFRGRAALSGHIQFKHPIVANGKGDSDPSVGEQMGLLKAGAELLEFNKKEIAQIIKYREEWAYIKGLLESAKFTINKGDLTTYMIASIAQMKANRRLLDEMAKPISELIRVIELQSQIIKNISK